MADDFVCWQCGTLIADELRPLSTYAECRRCRAQLHCCRMCGHFNPRLRTDCNEPRAESVSDREKANFCDWFNLRRGAYKREQNQSATDNRAGLKALFGDDTGSQARGSRADPNTQLDDLFGGARDDY